VSKKCDTPVSKKERMMNMIYSIEKTENDYKINIRKGDTEITLTKEEMLSIMSDFKVEMILQDYIVIPLSDSGAYDPNLFIDFRLWTDMTKALRKTLPKCENEQIAVEMVKEQFKKKLNKYRKPKKETMTSD
jgi:hypothetical protein